MPPEDQGFPGYANQPGVSRDLRQTLEKQGKSMDKQLIFCYLLYDKSDEFEKVVRTDGIVR